MIRLSIKLVTLVIFYFGVEGRICLLIVPVPGLCIFYVSRIELDSPIVCFV